MSPPDDASSSEYGFGPTRPRVVVFVSSPLFAVTIDKGAKYKFSGASATQNSKEHAIQGLTTSLLHPMSNNVTNNYSTSVRIGDLSPWRHLTACSPCHEVEHTVAWQYIRMNSACHVPRPVWTSRLRLLSAVVPSVRLAYRCSSLLCVRISIRFSRIQTKQSAPRQTRILWSRRCASFSAKLQWWTTAMRKASAKYVWGGAASACHLPPCVR